jgi:hypothetical protein
MNSWNKECVASVSKVMSSATATVFPAIEPDHLPVDPAQLKAILAEVLAAPRASRQEGERLRERIDHLLGRLYGPRSERLHPNQLLLFTEPDAAGERTLPPPRSAHHHRLGSYRPDAPPPALKDAEES